MLTHVHHGGCGNPDVQTRPQARRDQSEMIKARVKEIDERLGIAPEGEGEQEKEEG